MKDPRIEQIADYYGLSNQLDMAIEEGAELTQAICKSRRAKDEAEYKKTCENLKEELADLIVVAKQLRYLFGKDDIDRIIDQKLNRQIERIRQEEENNG